MFKQFIYELKSEPVVTWVTITGTALAIFLIMTVVMMQEVKTAPYPPESNRDRMLHWGMMSITHPDWGDGSSNGPMSYWAFKNIILPLESAETVTVYASSPTTHSAALRDKTPVKADVLGTDHRFFNVFDLQFTSGKPFDEAQFDSGRPLAVVTENMARQLFGSAGEETVGREFLLDMAPYKIVGIVRDVSPLADHAYADIWIPLTSTEILNDTWNNGYMGMLSSTILARDENDFPAILAELDKIKADVNTQLKAGDGFQYIWRNRPYTTEKDAVGKWANVEPDLKQARRSRLIVYLILLIVPAINLSSMTQSRVKRRMSEIAVRQPQPHPRIAAHGKPDHDPDRRHDRIRTVDGVRAAVRPVALQSGHQRHERTHHGVADHAFPLVDARHGNALLLHPQSALHRSARMARLAVQHRKFTLTS